MSIKIITRDDCPYCDMAKKVLADNELEFEELMIDRDIEREQVLEMIAGDKAENSLPIFIYEEEVKGNYNQLLDHVFPSLE
jgi:glutaredoxin